MAKTATSSAGTAVVGIFGYPGCSAWITAGLLELFAIANNAIRLLPQARTSRRRAARKSDHVARFDCEMVASSRVVRGSHGVTFAAQTPRRRYRVLIVPPVWCESREDLEQRVRRLGAHVDLLSGLEPRCDILASTCSGGVLLANAGLLDQYRATTCWWLAGWFRDRYPQIELVPDRLVVQDRDRWTAAAGSAYVHLGLELVRELAGDAAAATTARLMLVERRRGSQSPFMSPDLFATRDPDVMRATRYLSEHAGAAITIDRVIRALSISERTLARKFQAALGMSPIAYLQSRRIARARELLESTSQPLERIVEQCGYEDVASFRKLFARHVGMTPREYRSRFAADR